NDPEVPGMWFGPRL
uniref:Pyrokinin-6 n=1 Tax=Validiblatta australasiae TaxID=36975 RepID=PPK6_VALAU|nr:RecName: Full=Pyrokinin-6; Short=Perau-PK-6; AltName: Full=FXPRL-amide [Periplaneta australasiae]